MTYRIYDKLLNVGLVDDDYETIRIVGVRGTPTLQFAGKLSVQLKLTDWENESLTVVMREEKVRDLITALTEALEAGQ